LSVLSSRRRAPQPGAGQFRRVNSTGGPADRDARRASAGPLVVLFPRPAKTQGQAGQDRNRRRSLVQMSDLGHAEGDPGRSSVGRRAGSRANSYPGDRRREFGPMIYAALLGWGLVAIYGGRVRHAEGGKLARATEDSQGAAESPHRSTCSRSSSRTPAPRCRTRPLPGD